MVAYYCQTHDTVIVLEASKTGILKHCTHVDTDGVQHEWYYMGYWHPDFTRGEVEDIVRNRINTFGIAYEQAR